MSQNAKPRVYVTDFITDELAIEKRILGDIADVRALSAEREEELRGRIEDGACIMMYHFLDIRAETISRLKQCKLIVRCGVGFDNVDAAAARANGITVCNVPDYGTEDVADTAIAIMLALTRGTHFLNSRLRLGRGDWSYTQAVPLHRLRGRTFAVIGLGRIGSAAAIRAKAIGMNVIFYDPYVSSIEFKKIETLDELLAQAQVLSLHCPATRETIGLIGARQIARMPHGSFLINTARGAILDTSAIPSAIHSGQLAGAGIDVLEMEPPPENDPLILAWRNQSDVCHDRVIITPHAAFYSEEGLMEIRVKASRACRKALLGEALENVVN